MRRLLRFRDVLRDPGPVSRATVARLVLLGPLPILLMLIVGLLWAIHSSRVTRENQRDIHQVACRSYDALHRVIAQAPATSPELLQALGFTAAQAARLADEQARARVMELQVLGPRDSTCPQLQKGK